MQSMASNNVTPLAVNADIPRFGLKWLLLVLATMDVHAEW